MLQFLGRVDAISLLRSCRELRQGKQLHAKILANSGPASDTVIWNLIVQMYLKCGSLQDANAALDQISHPNALSVTLHIQSYARTGHLLQAKQLFDRSFMLDIISWTTLLKSVADAGKMAQAQDIFDRIPARDAYVWTCLITASINNGELHAALSLFQKMPQRNVITWTVLLSGLAGSDSYTKLAFELVKKVPEFCVVTIGAVIEALASNGYLREARELFASVPARNAVSCTSLLNSYSQRNQIDEAWLIFRKMPQIDSVCCSSMLIAFEWNDLLHEAERLFLEVDGVNDLLISNTMVQIYARSDKPSGAKSKLVFDMMHERDSASWDGFLSSYVNEGGSSHAEKIFHLKPAHNTSSSALMIISRGNSGDWMQSKQMFDQIPSKDKVVWNSLLTIYHNHELTENFVSVLDRMPAHSTTAMNLLFSIQAQEGSIDKARSTFDMIDHKTLPIWSGMLVLYARCGFSIQAEDIFDKMPEKDIVSWNIMIAAYAANTDHALTLSCFWKMCLEGVNPDVISFMAVLCCLSHSGLVDNARESFVLMLADFGVAPEIDHYHCLVDVLSRVGRIDEAECLLESMPFFPNFVTWTALLGSCRTHGVNHLALVAAENACRVNPRSVGPYMLLANIQAELSKKI